MVMYDKRKRRRILHINMLWKWHAQAVTDACSKVEEVPCDRDVPAWKEEGTLDPQPMIAGQLSRSQ